MPDLSTLRTELDHLEKRLPGEANMLVFSFDPDSRDYIGTHWHTEKFGYGPREMLFGKRGRDPEVVLSALRQHVGALIEPERLAAE